MRRKGQKWRFLLQLRFFCAFILMVTITSTEARTGRDWSVSIGTGGVNGPDYPGSDITETTASLDFEVVWKDRIILTPDGLDVIYYSNNSLTLNAMLSSGEERKDSLNVNLSGLGDIDASVSVALGVAVDTGLFSSYANLTKHNGGTDGTQVVAGFETAFPLGLLTGSADIESTEESFTGALLIAGLSTQWADTDYTSGFFGVDAVQSAGSGLPQYDARAGFNTVTLELSVLYPLGQSWTVQGFATYSEIVGDAEGSPIVRVGNYVYTGGIINYHF